MMNDLQKRMKKKLPHRNIYEYDIEWQEDGKKYCYLDKYVFLIKLLLYGSE